MPSAYRRTDEHTLASAIRSMAMAMWSNFVDGPLLIERVVYAMPRSAIVIA